MSVVHDGEALHWRLKKSALLSAQESSRGDDNSDQPKEQYFEPRAPEAVFFERVEMNEGQFKKTTQPMTHGSRNQSSNGSSLDLAHDYDTGTDDPAARSETASSRCSPGKRLTWSNALGETIELFQAETGEESHVEESGNRYVAQMKVSFRQGKARFTDKCAAITVKGPPIATPGRNDILMGRGKGITDYSGNVRFREMVQAKKNCYVHNFKYEKGDTARQILDKVAMLDPPGRFLRLSPDGLWRDVPIATALEKAYQALREKKWGYSQLLEPQNNEPQSQSNVGPKYPAATRPRDAATPTHTVTKGSFHLPHFSPNFDISVGELRHRVRSGARISVYDPLSNTYISGKVLKRQSSRLQLQTYEGSILNVDLYHDKIRIDSRRLNCVARRRRFGDSDDSRNESGDDNLDSRSEMLKLS